MNRAKAKRWLNEYLDGEIGLADKAEFERLMAQDPELRREYEQMRRIGLLMSSGPEVEVHPSAFRAKLMERIEPQQRFNFTPQRAFAASMLVALIVVGLAFGQFIYGRAMDRPGVNNVGVASGFNGQDSSSEILINASSSQFLNSTLQRAENGASRNAMQLVDQLDRQLGVFEGAVCAKGPNGYSYTFPGGLPTEFSIRADAASLTEIQAIAAGYPGSGSPAIELADGSKVSVNEYAVNHPQGRIDLLIRFSRP
ncbi:hypothetical protein KDL29_15550 [bacterium]|nr:hypothetical protein [bacterium]